ncbi:MAG: MerR family transcriptional regulator [Clostridia bacterium]|nr:MerR family transcriptional regulator [Clostridia bacterium]
MKINEVEQLVGITTKNIRFYEDQGLITPKRGSNGYRDYTDSDVELLKKIRLLRKLSVPIEEIKKVISGKLSLSECLERHKIYLNHEKENLSIVSAFCDELVREGKSFSDMPEDSYLERIETLEKGGTRLMDVSKTDVRKKKRGAKLAAAVMIVLFLMFDVFIFIGNHYEPLPKLLLVFLAGLPLIVVTGILIALIERMKEIEGGEADEAVNY